MCGGFGGGLISVEVNFFFVRCGKDIGSGRMMGRFVVVDRLLMIIVEYISVSG